MKVNTNLAANFSGHLFWDVDETKLEIEKDKQFIVQRVLGYGIMDDWKLLLKLYGIDGIANIAVNLRELDKKTATFIAFLSKIPTSKFRCYTIKQSTPQHWNF